jgi:hypothetical protein
MLADDALYPTSLPPVSKSESCESPKDYAIEHKTPRSIQLEWERTIKKSFQIIDDRPTACLCIYLAYREF